MKRAFAVIALFMLLSCTSKEDVRPAPSSSMTKAEALTFAREHWVKFAPGNTYCDVAATGSMVPMFDSRSVLLLEPVTTAQLTAHDIANYATAPDGTGPDSITHGVTLVEGGAFIAEGDSNRNVNDGFIAGKRLRYRVAGILYTQRLDRGSSQN